MEQQRPGAEIYEGSMHALPLDELGDDEIAFAFKGYSSWFGHQLCLHNIDLVIPKHKVTVVFGQSGCGKSVLLRSMNRLNELANNFRYKGDIEFNQTSIFGEGIALQSLRSSVGMMIQELAIFPASIYENIAFGVRLGHELSRRQMDDYIQYLLEQIDLWEEIDGDPERPALSLTKGQQQRLSFIRTLAIQPQVLLLDEPTSRLDPVATMRIESIIATIKKKCTVVISTHNVQQAARISDYACFLHEGTVIEYRETEQVFTYPRHQQTEDYLTGRYG